MVKTSARPPDWKEMSNLCGSRLRVIDPLGSISPCKRAAEEAVLRSSRFVSALDGASEKYLASEKLSYQCIASERPGRIRRDLCLKALPPTLLRKRDLSNASCGWLSPVIPESASTCQRKKKKQLKPHDFCDC